MYSSFTMVVIVILVWLWALPVNAQALSGTPKAFGLTGLSSFHSLRTQPKGAIYGGIVTGDPYIHSYAGMQISENLAVSLRQTALVSDLNDDADRLFPGTDLRWRLIKESTYLPETNLYMISAIGHKRMASEALTFSKRIYDFDLTGGLAWGRLGSAAHFDNPLKILSGHFGRRRSLDGEIPNGPEDWFTGEDIGAFASLTYSTPHDGLSITAEWGADRHIREAADLGYDTPEPWALGIDYTPVSWLSLGTALVGGNKIMGRLALTSPIEKWQPDTHYKTTGDKKPMRPYRTGLSLPGQMRRTARMAGIALYDVTRDTQEARAKLSMDKDLPLPLEIGRAATHMSNHAGRHVEAINLRPVIYGLDGPYIRILRKDLENARVHGQGSPEEIWQNTDIHLASANNTNTLTALHDRKAPHHGTDFDLILDNEMSLSEEDNGFLYRTALRIQTRTPLTRRFMNGTALRVNLLDNLHHLNELRPRALLPVRSNSDKFAERTIGLDDLYLGYSASLKPQLHLQLIGGYLEEMYAGIGGEVLYRPFNKRFAIGAELWQVFKRDPFTDLNMGLNGDHLATGHINVWYEFPESNLVLKASAGRYLAEDYGASLSLTNNFKFGGEVAAHITATDLTEPDIFGGTSNLYGGLTFTLPLGDLKYLPDGSHTKTRFAQIGRDTGQKLRAPLGLYELTAPFTKGALARYWQKIEN